MKVVKSNRAHQILALASILALSATAPAFAGFSQADNVTMGGEDVFKIASSADGFSAEHRAWLAQDALDNALVLSDDKSPSAVTVERRNGALIVALGGRKVATVDAGSAALEGCSVEQLADKWAQGIKSFLSDSDKASTYIATLKSPNQLQADIAMVVERRLFAPAGTSLPVTFTREISSQTCKAGDRIEAKLTQDVPMGNYVIPSGSLVIGELIETNPGVLAITFNMLRTPTGTELPICATACESYYVRSAGPHPVCTIGIPANSYTNSRLPATLGIGAVGASGTTTLAIQPGTSRVIAFGEPFSVVLDSVTPVAVLTRSPAM
jgi:hypothetical protein